MASIDQIKDADERALAARHIPADILSWLSAAELCYRTRHAKHLVDRARQVPVRESQQALSNHAAKFWLVLQQSSSSMNVLTAPTCRPRHPATCSRITTRWFPAITKHTTTHRVSFQPVTRFWKEGRYSVIPS